MNNADKLKQSQKSVVDTKAAVSKATDWAYAVEAVPAYAKARDALEDYLKEQDND